MLRTLLDIGNDYGRASVPRLKCNETQNRGRAIPLPRSFDAMGHSGISISIVNAQSNSPKDGLRQKANSVSKFEQMT